MDPSRSVPANTQARIKCLQYWRRSLAHWVFLARLTPDDPEVEQALGRSYDHWLQWRQRLGMTA